MADKKAFKLLMSALGLAEERQYRGKVKALPKATGKSRTVIDAARTKRAGGKYPKTDAGRN